jgi:hypothetical protein
MNTSGLQPLTFAVPTYGSDNLLKRNFLASPCFSGDNRHQFLIQRDYNSASRAYNDAIDAASNDLVVFVHQDMIFPANWLADLDLALKYMDSLDPDWGVLGCFGVTAAGVGQGYIYSPGRGIFGAPVPHPVKVQTLDEIVLIIRKSSGLRFDPDLPHFHLYGADICLRAAQKGMSSYVIPAFCIHNANQYCVLPQEYYECYRYIQQAWRDALPVQTTCLEVTKSNMGVYKRRLREAYVQIRRKGFIAPRADDISKLLADALSHASI